MVEAICRQYHPANITFDIARQGRILIFPNIKFKYHVIKGINSSGSIPKCLLTLGIGKNNARALRAWSLLFPTLGSITILVWTLRVLFLLYSTNQMIHYNNTYDFDKTKVDQQHNLESFLYSMFCSKFHVFGNLSSYMNVISHSPL